MKKLMFIAAAALCGAAFAGGEITSENVVGFAKKGIPANKFKQCGAQFEDVETSTILADKVLGGLPGVNYGGEWMTTAPQIQIVGTDGQPVIYYYLNDGWYDDGSEEGATKKGWCDDSGNIADLVFTPGDGFWVKNADAEAQNLQGSGQVGAADETAVDVPGGIWSIQANAYPIDIDLNNEEQVTFPDIIGVDYGGEWMKNAPQVQVVDDDGQPTIYYYLNDGWYDNGLEGGATKPGWCDDSGNIAEALIPAQAGFWVKATTGAFTIKYAK